MKILAIVGAALLLIVAFMFVLISPSNSSEIVSEKVVATPDETPDLNVLPLNNSEEPARVMEASANIKAATPSEAASTKEIGVYGIVLGPEKEAIAGAKVSILKNEDNYDYEDTLQNPLKAIAAVETGADGRFQALEVQPFQNYNVVVEAPGFAFYMGSVTAGRENKINLVRESILVGEVKDATTQLPVQGVEITFNQWGFKKFSVLTDTQGKYRFTQLPPYYRLDLEIYKEGYVPLRRFVNTQASEEKTLNLLLRRGVKLAGEVIDIENGAPVSNAELYYFNRLVAKSDGLGRFTLSGVDETRAELYVYAANYCGIRRDLNADLLNSGMEVRFPLIRGGEIEGSVRDGAGKAVVGAHIRLESYNELFDDNSAHEDSESNKVVLPRLPQGSWFQPARNSRKQSTDGSGHFLIQGVVPSPNPYQVIASHPDFPNVKNATAKLTRPGEKAYVDIVAGKGGVLEGVVTSEKKPVSAKVWVWNNTNYYKMIWTNQRGEFRFDSLPPGEIQIAGTLQEEGSSEGQQERKVFIKEGEVTHYELDLPSLKLKPISGRIISAMGKPVPGVYVNAWAQVQNNWVQKNTRTLADGSFRLDVEDLNGALFQLYATSGISWASKDKIPAGSENVELTLADPGKLRVKVTDSLTGEVLPSFDLRWRSTNSRRSRSNGSTSLGPDASGVTELDLGVGSYDLTVSADALGYQPTTSSGVNVLSDPNASPIRIEMQRGTRVEIQIANDSGEKMPKGYHWYYLLPATGNNRATKYFEVDDQGNAKLLGLAPGKYFIYVNPPNITLEPNTIDIPQADKVAVSVRWKLVEKK